MKNPDRKRERSLTEAERLAANAHHPPQFPGRAGEEEVGGEAATSKTSLSRVGKLTQTSKTLWEHRRPFRRSNASLWTSLYFFKDNFESSLTNIHFYVSIKNILEFSGKLTCILGKCCIKGNVPKRHVSIKHQRQIVNILKPFGHMLFFIFFSEKNQNISSPSLNLPSKTQQFFVKIRIYLQFYISSQD